MKGSEIRDLRRSLKLTQEEFAKKLGVHQTTIARWETDFVDPSPVAMNRLNELAAAQQPTKGHKKNGS